MREVLITPMEELGLQPGFDVYMKRHFKQCQSCGQPILILQDIPESEEQNYSCVCHECEQQGGNN